MAVKIRLRREGRRNRAFFRVVVTESRAPRDGRFIEQVGYYDPVADPAVIKLDTERIAYWVGVGAQPSNTVKDLLRRSEAGAAPAEAPAGAEEDAAAEA